jgi:hypothetical protein
LVESAPGSMSTTGGRVTPAGIRRYPLSVMPSNGTVRISIGGSRFGAAFSHASPIAVSAARNWSWSWENMKLAQW